MFYLLIEADTNDGDIVTKFETVGDEEFKLFKPIIDAIRKNHGKYETGEMIDKHDAEKLYGHLEYFGQFQNFVPNGDYGIHTIDSIKLVDVATMEDLL